MKSRYEGMWKGRSGWYRSRAFKKKDIKDLLLDGERKCIVLRYNKYRNKGDNRPTFIFAFADASDADNIADEIPFIETDAYVIDHDDEVYVTVDEAVQYARDGADMIRNGYGIYDTYCTSDLHGKTLAELIGEKREEK